MNKSRRTFMKEAGRYDPANLTGAAGLGPYLVDRQSPKPERGPRVFDLGSSPTEVTGTVSSSGSLTEIWQA